MNFDAPAGVFFGHRGAYGRCCGSLTYQRFPTLAEAVRFVAEELPLRSFAAHIETDEQDLGEVAICDLYRSAAYPLARKPARRCRPH